MTCNCAFQQPFNIAWNYLPFIMGGETLNNICKRDIKRSFCHEKQT